MYSGIAALVTVGACITWASSPLPRSPWLQALCWIVALAFGFFYATQGFRLAQSWKGRTMAAGLFCFHCFSFLLLGFMLLMIGARP
jgi:tryptophan-rich sensory protein